MQYEGGMNVTSAVIRGIFALTDLAGRKPDINEVCEQHSSVVTTAWLVYITVITLVVGVHSVCYRDAL